MFVLADLALIHLPNIIFGFAGAPRSVGVTATKRKSQLALEVSPSGPRQPFLPIYRRLVLPVHFLGRSSLTALLRCVSLVAGDVEFQDDDVVDDPVDGSGGGHVVGGYALPLGEGQVGRDPQRPAFGDEG